MIASGDLRCLGLVSGFLVRLTTGLVERHHSGMALAAALATRHDSGTVSGNFSRSQTTHRRRNGCDPEFVDTPAESARASRLGTVARSSPAASDTHPGSSADTPDGWLGVDCPAHRPSGEHLEPIPNPRLSMRVISARIRTTSTKERPPRAALDEMKHLHLIHGTQFSPIHPRHRTPPDSESSTSKP